MKINTIYLTRFFLLFSIFISPVANAQTEDETAIRAVMDKQIRECRQISDQDLE